MYNVKGPSKIVAKTTRRGMAQNLDSYRDHTRNKSVELEENDYPVTVPKPVFHNTTTKRNTNYHNNTKQEEVVSPQHEEIIKYIHDSWRTVCSEIDKTSTCDDTTSGKQQSVIYYEDDPCPNLQDFKPFDLESWWGKRLFIHITSSVNSKS